MRPDSTMFLRRACRRRHTPLLVTLTLLAPALLGLAPARSLAHPGDIVALVAANKIAAAPGSARGTTAPSSGRIATTDARLAGALATLGLDVMTALGPETDAGGPPVRLVLLSSSTGALDPARAREAMRQLAASHEVLAATIDRNLKFSATLPNDPDLPFQWSIDGTGDIHLPEAWDLELGSASVVIGILDTGVDTGHPDLASQIWTNPGEIPANSIDDDGNGYVDDVHGWDFGDNDADPNPTAIFDELGIDIAFHGTAVAGVAAAATNNAEGIAGAGWNSKILPLKITNTAGATLVSAAGEAILYAAAKHIAVLNMSVGQSNPDSTGRAFFQAMIDQAVAANVACVAAAGNDGTSVQVVPASCDGVLSVGSTSQTNTRSSFSNYGPWVDVGAPGEGIWAPICRNYLIDDTSLFIYEFFFGYDGVRPYMLSDGTSFSCPLAAGVCALVRAHFPGAKAIGVIEHVRDTGDAIAFDQPIGKKVNAYNALATLLDVAPGTPPTGGRMRLAGARPTPFAASTTIGYTLPQATRVRLVLINAAGRRVRTLADGEEAAGAHVLTWDGRDDAGRDAPIGLYFAVLDGAGERAVSRLVRAAR